MILAGAIVLGAIVALFAPPRRIGEVERPPAGPAQEAAQAEAAESQSRSMRVQQLRAARLAESDTQPREIRAAAFVERANGVYEASETGYRAQVSAGEGLRYFPKSADGKVRELRVKLSSVKRGGFSLFDRNDPDAADAAHDAAVVKGAGLSFLRSPVLEENYEPRGDGVEQSFVLESAATLSGPLEFVCELELKGLEAMPRRPNRNGGILFRDESGKVAARYGQVMVRDAAQKSIALEPISSSHEISFAVPQAWLEQAQFPIVVDPLVGSDFAISPNNPNGVSQSTVSAGTNNFLVAWVDYTAGKTTPVLVGSIVTASGKAGTPFAISNTVGVPLSWRLQRIEAAYDGSNWLVAWSDSRQAGPGIRGAIVGSNGAVLNGSDFLIAATSGAISEDPLVTFDGTNFIVSWTSTPPNQSGGSQVYYTRVNGMGVAGATAVVANLLTPANQYLEYMVSQQPSGDTLIVYEELLESPTQHRAVRIAPDGTVRDAAGGIALFQENQLTGGFGRPIGAVFTNGEFQILSTYDQTSSSKVFLHHLSTAGVVTPPSGVFAVVGNGPTGLSQQGQLIDSFAPAFAGTGEWLFLRNEKVSATVFHILGKRITFAGADMDPIPFQVDTSTQGVTRSAVAAQSGTVFLASWLDGRSATTQPGDSANIAAALIDAAAAGSVDPALIAVAAASPTSGESGVTVAFDASTSKGSYDTLSWDFGDGTTSSLVSPAHVYKGNSTFIARLKLTKGAYSVVDTVVITVGTGGGTGSGGSQIGIPLANTPPIVPGLFIKAVNLTLDFKNLNNDKATVVGIFDVTKLGGTLTGKVASFAIGGASYSFNLDAKGQFKSAAGAVPSTAFAIDMVKGTFSFTLTAGNIRTEMAALGALNGNVPAGTIVPLPISVSVDVVSGTATVGAGYHATINVGGAANYGFLGAGNEISGSFLISTFSGAESGGGTHTYTIKGRLVKPGVFKPSAVGNFVFYLGTYQVSIQSGAIFNKGGTLTYTQSQVKNGLKKFTIDLNSGAFLLHFVRIPADTTTGGTGLPLSKSGTDQTSIDMNLSFAFDLASDPHLTAGRLIYISRKNAAAKSWALR